MSFYSKRPRGAASVQVFRDSMMQCDTLPLSDVIQGELFEEAFDRFDVDFGADDDAVYTPALVLWALVSQALFTKTQRSLTAAVTRIASWWACQGRVVGDTSTGAYSRARHKLPVGSIAWLTQTIAQRCECSEDLVDAIDEDMAEETLTPDVVGRVRKKSIAGRVILVDGFTVDAADTPANQQEYPQNPSQKEGLGFPMLRCVSLISMATGLLIDLAIGPYAGKQSGETALLRQLFPNLHRGDIIVADSFYCSYWLLAYCQINGIEVAMKNHHKREDCPVAAKKISKHQRTTTWLRPTRPSWMSEEDYDSIPDQLEVRLVDVKVNRPGFRTEGFTVATTMLDHKSCPAEWIASLYRSRWIVELDIESIKCSLEMEHLRAKTPEMVRRELWSCLLAYNLIRMKMLQSGAASNRDVRSMSFTRCMTLLATNWLLCGARGTNEALVELGQSQPLDEVIGHRPDRVEPRVNKRRPKVLKLMSKPRSEYDRQLANAV
ncbi:IS4 family transposase [Roseiconus lacunae]|uniref:IS4 family transposase n=2 Tax=Roseiconus lacunae TaxID=2605694 RepID=A0ABT7PSK2_9BACT|nr:IS4 family transposase [Roseiconus lacunae]MDM4019473.1 IS4 family transposase [Roseiconus lacunae]